MPVQVSESEDQKVASTGSCSVLRIPLLCPGGGKRCLMGGEAMLPNEKAARGGKRGAAPFVPLAIVMRNGPTFCGAPFFAR